MQNKIITAVFFVVSTISSGFADIYDSCGANGEQCFAIPFFESDIKTCLAERVKMQNMQ